MALSLKISVVEKNVTKTMKFAPATTVFDVCKIIREKCSELPNMDRTNRKGCKDLLCSYISF